MNSRIVRLADFEFDAASGELRRGVESVRLEPQPARVLALLIDRAGEVVTRTELQQAVWRGDTFVDFERGLNYCVAQIRTALGDSASAPRFIETLPRRGYRLIAPVSAVSLEAAVQVAPSGTDRNDPPGVDVRSSDHVAPSPRRLRRAASIGVAAAVAIAAAWAIVSAGHQRPLERTVRIAVVPFDNETGIADYDVFAQMLTDATVARLAADPDRLAVIGNAAILRTPRQRRDLIAIGDALAVGHVVLGQVQQIDGRLRITTHLIRVRDQAHLWAHRFEPAAGSAPTLDREVADAVAGAVGRRLLQR